MTFLVSFSTDNIFTLDLGLVEDDLGIPNVSATVKKARRMCAGALVHPVIEKGQEQRETKE